MKTNLKRNSTGRAVATDKASAGSANTGGKGNGSLIDSVNPANSESALVCVSKSSSESLPASIEVGAFVELIEAGIICWTKAGELLVGLVKAHGMKAFLAIKDKCPWITDNLLWSFYRIGTRELYPHVLILPRNAMVSRRLALLPYDTQKDICENGLDVADNDATIRRRKVAELDTTQIHRALRGAKIISPTEQLKVMSEEMRFKSKPPPKPTFVPTLPDTTISAGAYRVELDLNDGRIKFERHSGAIPLSAVRVHLGPNKGKLVAYFDLRKPGHTFTAGALVAGNH